MPRLNAILAHWAAAPPVHISVAAFMGIQAAPSPIAGPLVLDNAAVVREMRTDPRKLEWSTDQHTALIKWRQRQASNG